MASARAVWGIDIGQCALKALRVRVVGEKLEVIGHEYIEHEKILSQPEADRGALVTSAIAQFLSRHDPRQDQVIVSVPGQHTLSRFTKLPPVDKKKIPDIVRFEANQQIPFDMDEVIWDYQTFMTEDSPEVEVGIFAMRRELVAEHLRPLALAGIEPVIVQSAPLALFNALQYDGVVADGATLILDIGAQNTDLIVTQANSLWTRNIPLGGNNFTEALLKTFKISFTKAESLKRAASSSKYARQIFQAMRPVFADLVAEIQRSMGFYSSTHRGVRVKRVVAMGNAFKLPGLQKFLQSNLGMEVVRPSTFGKLSVASAENAPQLIEHLLSYGVAYGLALQGAGRSAITSNLLPPEIARAIIWKHKMPWFWAAAASLAFAALLVWGRFIWDASVLADAAGGYAARQQTLSEEQARNLLRNPPSTDSPPLAYAAKIRDLATSLQSINTEWENKGNQQEQQIQKIIDVQQDKLLWPRIIDEIHKALPEPQPELAAAMAQGPEAYKKAIKQGGPGLARDERRQVFLHSFAVAYSDNVGAAFDQAFTGPAGPSGPAPGGTRAPGVAARGGAAGTGINVNGPGYVVRLVGQTPNKDRTRFLEQVFLKDLAEITPEKHPELDFAVVIEPARVFVWAEQVSEHKADTSGGRRTAQRGVGGAYGASAWSPSPTPGGSMGFSGIPTIDKSATSKIDPLTGEETGNDWIFEIMFKVVLVPKNGKPRA